MTTYDLPLSAQELNELRTLNAPLASGRPDLLTADDGRRLAQLVDLVVDTVFDDQDENDMNEAGIYLGSEGESRCSACGKWAPQWDSENCPNHQEGP